VDGAKFEVDEGVVDRGNARAVELGAKAIPGLLGGGVEFAPVEQDVALVGVEVEGEAVAGEAFRGAQVFEAGERVAEGEDG
jgi:hypothetical protein